MLEGVAISFPRGIFPPHAGCPWVEPAPPVASTLAEGFFTTDPPGKPRASPVKPYTFLIVNEFVIILCFQL